MESVQKHLAAHPVSRIFFWRRGRYGPQPSPAVQS
jgi:hypothetical protein